MDEYLTVLKEHYSDFEGRARRREYWMFQLVHTIILLVLCLPILLIEILESSIVEICLIPLFLYFFITFVPQIAVLARRFHDIGRTGWMQLLGVIPYVGILIMFCSLIIDSQAGSNNWGPNPKRVKTKRLEADEMIMIDTWRQ